MGPIGCPEMSVRNYGYSLRNKPEERSSQACGMVQAVEPSASWHAPSVVRTGFVLDPVIWVGFCVLVLRFSHVSVIPSASISLFYSFTTFPPKLYNQQWRQTKHTKPAPKTCLFLLQDRILWKINYLYAIKHSQYWLWDWGSCGFVDGTEIYIYLEETSSRITRNLLPI